MFQLPESWKINNRINEARSESFESWADKTRYLSEQARSDNVVRVLSFPEISPSGKQEMIKEFFKSGKDKFYPFNKISKELNISKS